MGESKAPIHNHRDGRYNIGAKAMSHFHPLGERQMTTAQTRIPGLEFLHQEMEAGPDDLIEVTLDNPANVLLLDPENYEHYCNNRPYSYYGGYAESSPYRLRSPNRGKWHLVVDLGGGPGHVRAFLRVFSEPVSAGDGHGREETN
jgi:hypothetical protein